MKTPKDILSISAMGLILLSLTPCFGQVEKIGSVGNTGSDVQINARKEISYYGYSYVPKMRLFGDTLYVATSKGLYRKDLRDRESGFSLVGFEGLKVVDFSKKGEEYLAVVYGNIEQEDSLIFLSKDGGKTHQDITQGRFVQSRGTISSVIVNPKNPMSLVINTSYKENGWGSLFLTFDYGRTWSQIPRVVDGSKIVFAYHPLDTTLLFQAGARIQGPCVVNSTIACSEDNGDSWEEVYVGGYNLHDLAFHPENPNILLYARWTSTIGKSTDRGKTWRDTKVSQDYDGYLSKIVFNQANPQTVYALTGVVLFSSKENYNVSIRRSVDEGDTWEDFYQWKPSFEEIGVVLDVLYYQNKLLFYTVNGGIYALNLDEVPDAPSVLATGRAEEPVLEIHPNPVRDVLRFETEADIRRVMITDMRGRTVRNKVLPDGMREISLRGLPTGMYVACFYTETACVRRKISVVR